MKVIFFILSIILITYSTTSATETIVKFYMNDGSPPQEYNINDIEVVKISNKSFLFKLRIYYKPGLYDDYQSMLIDTLKFEKNLLNQDLFSIYLIGSTKSYLISEIDSVIFYQNNEFKTIKIGDQVWMQKNLNVDHYHNGDSIPEVTDPTEWSGLTTGAWCYYDNDPANGPIYGKLYNWYAVNDPRGLTPNGFHVPTDNEWTILTDYLGGEWFAGALMKEAGTTHWQDPNTGATNSSGFTALPAGLQYYDARFFAGMNYAAYFWTSNSWNSFGYIRALSFDAIFAVKDYLYMKYGLSVRCIKE